MKIIACLFILLCISLSEIFDQNLKINEIHADPAGDLTGDANGDGSVTQADISYIESFMGRVYCNNDGSCTGYETADYCPGDCP